MLEKIAEGNQSYFHDTAFWVMKCSGELLAKMHQNVVDFVRHVFVKTSEILDSSESVEPIRTRKIIED